MKLVDTNVLVHAVNTASDRHGASAQWLSGALDAREAVAIPWLALVGFVRIVTHPRVLPRPLAIDSAFDAVDQWVAHPRVICPEPRSRHTQSMRQFLSAAGVGGNLTVDAHLAALALEHRATVVSCDADFGRFPGITWRTPEQLLQERQ